jgi:hypothetical protein
MKTLIVSVLLIALSSFGFIADQTYTWEQYKLQITVPDYLKVKKNTADEFVMEGNGMDLSMDIFEQNIGKDEMDEAVIEGAKSLKLTEIDAEEQIEGDGLDGYYVEGYKNGKRVIFAGMIDPKSRTNFFLVIVFNDRDKQAEADAEEIVENVISLN